MDYNLFIDDLAFDPDSSERHPPAGFIAVTSSQQALSLIHFEGFPIFVSFDHDLGGDDKVMNFLYMLQQEYDLSSIKPFDYQIHSANPVGRENIKSFMESWKKVYYG